MSNLNIDFNQTQTKIVIRDVVTCLLSEQQFITNKIIFIIVLEIEFV